ncbi:DUF3515 family protein [Paramicrobacterium agarici]|uniref:Uncharacterized protein DUF3515 n=1 Tax=Paramicrobacterium agarici TaxID=630514 RepID=A0A2A9E038_9MICO|nr:DUF3515 family protein [Microbacterium agarici]PFG31549.1 uncharacterized protein DUF3515 [Microbacterium agarici]
MMHTLARAASAAVLACASALSLTACAGAVAMDPAPHSNDPACAAVTVRLPDAIGTFEKRQTTAQATGAWGDPASILLHCGVEPVGPTTMPCFSVNGVDWVRDDSDDPVFRFTTYGRTPAVEVIIDNREASGSALLDLSPAVSVTEATSKCLNAEDVTG